MTRYTAYIGQDKDKSIPIYLNGNETARDIAHRLIVSNMLSLSDFDAGLNVVTLYYNDKQDTLTLTDDSGYPYATLMKEEEVGEKTINDLRAEAEQKAKTKPRCPTCGSTNIRKLSAATRGVSLGLFGLASKTARSQFVCENCGYKW